MRIDSADIRLLTEIGFLGAGRGEAPQALRIFKALTLLRHEQAFGFIGMASALMNSGRANEAVQQLQSVDMPDGPERDMLDAFRGLALQLAGRSGESTYLLRQLLQNNRNTPHTEGVLLASRLLGEAPRTTEPAEDRSPPSF